MPVFTAELDRAWFDYGSLDSPRFSAPALVFGSFSGAPCAGEGPRGFKSGPGRISPAIPEPPGGGGRSSEVPSGGGGTSN
jgi:hypothetical protein